MHFCHAGWMNMHVSEPVVQDDLQDAQQYPAVACVLSSCKPGTPIDMHCMICLQAITNKGMLCSSRLR